jgi:hypothetical protein
MVSTTIRIHPFHPFQSVVIFNLPVVWKGFDHERDEGTATRHHFHYADLLVLQRGEKLSAARFRPPKGNQVQ